MDDQRVSAIVPVAQVVGITSSAFLAGMIACVSYIGIPTIALAQTDLLVRQWKTTYNIGKASAPPLALTCAASFGFLAYSSKTAARSGSSPVSPLALYTAAALAIPAIVPYTLLIMEPAVNRKLMHLANAAETRRDGTGLSIGTSELKELLSRWKRMNLVRAMIVGVGAVLGALASLVA